MQVEICEENVRALENDQHLLTLLHQQNLEKSVFPPPHQPNTGSTSDP